MKRVLQLVAARDDQKAVPTGATLAAWKDDPTAEWMGDPRAG